MSEVETRMAVGRKKRATIGKEGDRAVTYDQDGKHWTVSFVKKRATSIESE